MVKTIMRGRGQLAARCTGAFDIFAGVPHEQCCGDADACVEGASLAGGVLAADACRVRCS
jgi:hypothetical protein